MINRNFFFFIKDAAPNIYTLPVQTDLDNGRVMLERSMNVNRPIVQNYYSVIHRFGESIESEDDSAISEMDNSSFRSSNEDEERRSENNQSESNRSASNQEEKLL